MEQFLTVFGLVFSIFFISFLLINVRQIVIGKDFRGTCAQNNPLLKTKIGDCSVCGKSGDEVCKNPEFNNPELPRA
ncbi:MAG: hypothetical protein ACRBFS_02410 [Aureispira sp.]